MPYKSGFCTMGACEGTAPRNVNGSALPTCKMIIGCSCSCHAVYDEMFRVSEMERTSVDNSGYVPDHGDFVSVAECRRLSEMEPSVGRTYIESEDPDRVPATVARAFAQTPTGISAKGELEAYVDQVCKAWVIDAEGTLCTPAYISKEIASNVGIKAPSVGAIGAVFDRWVKIGYADCQRKPVRFVSYTDQGRELGLNQMKVRAKRQHARVR